MAKIVDIKGREVLDSRGNPTVEADVLLDNGIIGSACAPSGASTGSREALELRDGDKSRYLGKGVLKASTTSTPIRELLLGLTRDRALDRAMIDLDGTDKAPWAPTPSWPWPPPAGAQDRTCRCTHRHFGGTPGQYSMPVPMMNIINGGEHADNNVDIQEFMVSRLAPRPSRKACAGHRDLPPPESRAQGPWPEHRRR
jgi:enolase